MKSETVVSLGDIKNRPSSVVRRLRRGRISKKVKVRQKV